MPFTFDQFFDVFRRYNAAIWPLQCVLAAMAIVAVMAVMSAQVFRIRLALIFVAGLWFWTGAGYHFAFFARINPAAWLFGSLAIIQGLLLLWAARKQAAPLRPRTGLEISVAATLIFYALIAYPLIGIASGHRYPATPTFGAPCPTTIFTLGWLCLLSAPAYLLIIPLLWAIIGSFGAFQFGVIQDYAMPLAALLAIVVYLQRRSDASASAPI